MVAIALQRFVEPISFLHGDVRLSDSAGSFSQQVLVKTDAFRANALACADDVGAIENMEQFTHIAGPHTFREFAQSFAGKARPPCGAKGLGDARNVVPAVRKGGNTQEERIEALEEIRAELSLSRHGENVSVRGANDADIHRHGACATKAGHHFVLQDAKEPGLYGKRHFTDLIKKNRTPVRHFQQTRLAPASRAGERAFFIAEKLTLQQRFR